MNILGTDYYGDTSYYTHSSISYYHYTPYSHSTYTYDLPDGWPDAAEEAGTEAAEYIKPAYRALIAVGGVVVLAIIGVVVYVCTCGRGRNGNRRR
jgi:hypothetical protein